MVRTLASCGGKQYSMALSGRAPGGSRRLAPADHCADFLVQEVEPLLIGAEQLRLVDDAAEQVLLFVLLCDVPL